MRVRAPQCQRAWCQYDAPVPNEQPPDPVLVVSEHRWQGSSCRVPFACQRRAAPPRPRAEARALGVCAARRACVRRARQEVQRGAGRARGWQAEESDVATSGTLQSTSRPNRWRQGRDRSRPCRHLSAYDRSSANAARRLRWDERPHLQVTRGFKALLFAFSSDSIAFETRRARQGAHPSVAKRVGGQSKRRVIVKLSTEAFGCSRESDGRAVAHSDAVQTLLHTHVVSPKARLKRLQVHFLARTPAGTGCGHAALWAGCAHARALRAGKSASCCCAPSASPTLDGGTNPDLRAADIEMLCVNCKEVFESRARPQRTKTSVPVNWVRGTALSVAQAAAHTERQRAAQRGARHARTPCRRLG